MLASKKWRCTVICGLHNHELCAKSQGHPSICRLNPEEKTSIRDISLNLVQPKNILATLKRKEPDSVSNIRQMYNQRYHNNKASWGDRSEMQQLLKMLDANKYASRYRTCVDKVMYRDIFWTHPDSIKLFNTFPTMLILDSTYKTNKYRLPLFEMVGVTST
ncbi:protein FAR1-RELATED SEQUENCE 5-like [Vicia villosa]|uniref:protein FAR1-RELATED SEQUENCE 5-like n=1 Tax=Vicia villosa TaxID=3911 RepID=UPI00273B5151|nr:protein FAR1-RELATED SEQUENCE 5-like [Vicia villosa]